MKALKTNDSDSQSSENVIRGDCYQFLTGRVPIYMVLIPSRNIASLSYEIDLK
jgi:hypothetical protein